MCVNRAAGVVLSADGGVRCWGDNTSGEFLQSPCVQICVADATATMPVTASGQLGDGSNTGRNVPAASNVMIGAVTVACGYAHTCVVTQAGGIK